MSPTQRKALAALARRPARHSYNGNRGQLFGAPRGANERTYGRLAAMGLASVHSARDRQQILAGPFGRTRGYGWRTVETVETEWRITDAGRGAL